MARAIMGGDFRAIRRESAPVEEQPDPRLALVDLFVNGQQAPQGFIDLSSGQEGEHYDDLFVEDAQEPAEQPVAEESENSPVEAAEAVDEAPVQPEPEEKTEDPEPVAAEDDYDPIAAVLG